MNDKSSSKEIANEKNETEPTNNDGMFFTSVNLILLFEVFAQPMIMSLCLYYLQMQMKVDRSLIGLRIIMEVG